MIRDFAIDQPDEECVGLFGYVESSGKISDLGVKGFSVTGRVYVGGMCGYSSGTIVRSFAKGSVAGDDYVGGLCGSSFDGKISGCYAIGTVSGGVTVGGLTGGGGDVEDCYAAVAVFGEAMGSWRVGGLIGSGWGLVNRCVWDVEISGQTVSHGGKGATTEQMKSMRLYQDAGWSGRGWVINQGADYPRLAWEGTEGAEIEEPVTLPFAGSGTERDPYRIYTGEEFALLSQYWSALDKHFVLMNDVYLADLELRPIGELGVFNGMFDGRRYALRNATIHQAGNTDVGLWARIGAGGHVRNVAAEDIDIRGGSCVGGLAGCSDGRITNCHVAGTVYGLWNVGGVAGDNGGDIRSSEARGSVSGGEAVGGLCGTNYGLISDCHAVGDVLAFDWIGGAHAVGGLCGANWWGDIDRCSARGSVAGGDTAGGLCGDNAEGRISRSYATGAVTGDHIVGGLCGYNEGLISDCYATGAVSGSQEVGGLCGLSCGFGEPSIARSFAAGRVSGMGDDPLRLGGLLGGFYSEGQTGGCFWDVDASGIDVSEGGVGKTTEEMRMRAIFAGAGWDFVGEDSNGGADVWRMCADGVSYPRLSWEYSRGGDFHCPEGVGLEDLRYLAERWLAADAEAVGAADGNGDGRADMGDFGVMAEKWRVRPLHHMVLIPAGTFQMGDDRSEGWPGETPVHTVTLSSFFMSRYETTNAQYCRFLNWAMQQGLIAIYDGTVFKADSGFDFRYCNTDVRDSGSQIVFSDGVFSVRTEGGRDMDNDPMVKVSWYGAAAYCNWLSEQEGLAPCYDLSAGECDFTKSGYRLPTEAQWEYAARGGLCGKRFPWGDTISHAQANYYSEHDSWYDYDISPTRGYHPEWYDGTRPVTSPVGSFAANGYGLYDMGGNVEEWCNDWRGNYGDSWQTDPIGPATGDFRAVRGGGWGSEGRACRVTSRHVYSYPDGTDLKRGFRVCR